MSKYSIELDTLVDIGDAIREKDGTIDPIPVTDLADRIKSLPLSTDDIVETPLSIYVKMRNPDWPILPHPEQGEIYFLARPTITSSTYKIPTPPSFSGDNDPVVQFGYIDENGFFQSVLSTVPSSYYWNHYSVSIAQTASWPEIMQKYVVIKTTGDYNATSSPSCNSTNSTSNNTGSANVLEVKVNCAATRYFSAGIDYPASFESVEFITFYNESFAANTQFSFKTLSSLKTVIFRNANPFTDPTFKATGSWTELFYGCNQLRAMYKITNCSSGSAKLWFSSCYILKDVDIDLSECQNAYPTDFGGGSLNGLYSLKNLSINIPRANSVTWLSNVFPGGNSSFRVKKLEVPQSTAKISALPQAITELCNVDLVFNMSSASPANGQLKRITMSPTMTRSCGTMNIKSFVMTKEDLLEWFTSLPVLQNETATLVITNITSLKGQDITDIIAIATDKGYTVTR